MIEIWTVTKLTFIRLSRWQLVKCQIFKCKCLLVYRTLISTRFVVKMCDSWACKLSVVPNETISKWSPALQIHTFIFFNSFSCCPFFCCCCCCIRIRSKIVLKVLQLHKTLVDLYSQDFFGMIKRKWRKERKRSRWRIYAIFLVINVFIICLMLY